MSLWDAFEEYLKINKFALWLLLFYALLISFRWIKLRISAKRLFWIALAVGVLLRLLWIGFSSHQPQTAWQPNSMEADWINIHAIDLTKGVWFQTEQGVPAGRRPIGYPMLLGLAYKIFGVHDPVVWGLQLALFIAAFFLIFKIGTEIFESKAALWAAFLFAVYPISIFSAKLITDEHLFLPLWYFGIWLLLRELNGKPVKWPLLWYGVIFGYATMTRTHSIFMPVVVAWVALRLKKNLRAAALAGVLTLLGMQLINAPWILRNYKAWGAPVLYVPVSCFMYAQVNSTAVAEEGKGRLPVLGDPGYNPEIQKAQLEGKEALASQLCSQEMRKWILSHPGDFIYMGLRRLLVFMNWNRDAGVWPLWFQYIDGHYDPARPLENPLKEILENSAFVSYYIVLHSFLFALAAFAFGWKKLPQKTRDGILLLGLCLGFWMSEHLIIYADRKYRFPLEPLMIIFASTFLAKLPGFDFTAFKSRFLKAGKS